MGWRLGVKMKISDFSVIVYFLLACCLVSSIYAQSQDEPLVESIASLPIDDPPGTFTDLLRHESALILVGGYPKDPVWEYSARIILYDVSDPYGPWEIARYDSSKEGGYTVDDSPIYKAGLAWPYLYLPAENRLEIVDLRDTANPSLAGTFNPPGMQIQGGTIYFAGNKAVFAPRFKKQLYFLDASNPVDLQILSHLNIPAPNIVRIVWDGGQYAYLLIAEGDHAISWGWENFQLLVLDLSDLNTPRIVKTIPMNKVMGVTRVGHTLITSQMSYYTFDSKTIYLQVYDLSDPTAPKQLPPMSFSYCPEELIPVKNLYAATDPYWGGIGIYRWDGFNLRHLVQEDRETGYPCLVVDGNYLYAVRGLEKSLYVFDLLAPANVVHSEWYR